MFVSRNREVRISSRDEIESRDTLIPWSENRVRKRMFSDRINHDVIRDWKSLEAVVGKKTPQPPTYLSMIRRMNTSMPALYLQEHSDLSYQTVAVQLLVKSMNGVRIFEPQKTLEDEDHKRANAQTANNKMESRPPPVMSRLLDQTTNFSNEVLSCTVIAGGGGDQTASRKGKNTPEDSHNNVLNCSAALDNQRYLEPSIFELRNDHVFGAINLEDVEENAQGSMPTPDLEKAFNQTINDAVNRHLGDTLRYLSKATKTSRAKKKNLLQGSSISEPAPLLQSTPVTKTIGFLVRGTVNGIDEKTAAKVVIDDPTLEEESPSAKVEDVGWMGGGGVSRLGSYIYSPEPISSSTVRRSGGWDVSQQREIVRNVEPTSSFPHQLPSEKLSYPSGIGDGSFIERRAPLSSWLQTEYPDAEIPRPQSTQSCLPGAIFLDDLYSSQRIQEHSRKRAIAEILQERAAVPSPDTSDLLRLRNDPEIKRYVIQSSSVDATDHQIGRGPVGVRQDPAENQEISFTLFEAKIGSNMEPSVVLLGEERASEEFHCDPRWVRSGHQNPHPRRKEDSIQGLIIRNEAQRYAEKQKDMLMISQVHNWAANSKRYIRARNKESGEYGMSSITERITTRIVVKDERFLEPGEHSSGK
ncbi:unnamed protein product [Caenorhabditis auriculariae]|uniref:Uncharacterized protein n=1 Tax=Caenorhabditis auriculariae TaxID=2777116 RepID=A0A8S1H2Y4_9PELO|nr:unnamed protein product [Caenorhabditis auriculariae]